MSKPLQMTTLQKPEGEMQRCWNTLEFVDSLYGQGSSLAVGCWAVWHSHRVFLTLDCYSYSLFIILHRLLQVIIACCIKTLILRPLLLVLPFYHCAHQLNSLLQLLLVYCLPNHFINFVGGFKHIFAESLDGDGDLAVLAFIFYAHAQVLLHVGYGVEVCVRKPEDGFVWNSGGLYLTGYQLYYPVLGWIYISLWVTTNVEACRVYF